jgi:hypothetical protein
MILDHLDNIVWPTLRNYVTADRLFVEAQKSGVDEARHAAMLAARHAAIDLHHLSDFVVNNPAPGATFADLRAARAAVQSHLIFLREPKARPTSTTSSCSATWPTPLSTSSWTGRTALWTAPTPS